MSGWEIGAMFKKKLKSRCILRGEWTAWIDGSVAFSSNEAIQALPDPVSTEQIGK